MKLDRIRWKRTKGRQHLLLDKVYDAVTGRTTMNVGEWTFGGRGGIRTHEGA